MQTAIRFVRTKSWLCQPGTEAGSEEKCVFFGHCSFVVGGHHFRSNLKEDKYVYLLVRMFYNMVMLESLFR